MSQPAPELPGLPLDGRSTRRVGRGPGDGWRLDGEVTMLATAMPATGPGVAGLRASVSFRVVAGATTQIAAGGRRAVGGIEVRCRARAWLRRVPA